MRPAALVAVIIALFIETSSGGLFNSVLRKTLHNARWIRNNNKLVMLTQGKYELTLNQFTTCPDEGAMTMKYDLQRHKLGSNQFGYSGNITIPQDMDGKFHVDVDIAKWGSSGWGQHAFTTSGANQCKLLKIMATGYFNSLTAALGVEPECPIPKGTYYVKDWVIDMAVPFPILPFGTYQVDVVSSNDTDRLGCVRWLLDVSQKVNA